MTTRRETRIKHRRTRRTIAALTAVSAIGLGIGLAAPAGARTSGQDGKACSSSYSNGVNSGTSGNSGGTSGSDSNNQWC